MPDRHDIPAAREGIGRRPSLARRTAAAIGRHIAEVLENEELASQAGLLQGIEPRVRLLAILLFAVTASLLRSPWLLATMSALAASLAAASGVRVRSFARKVWGSAGLFAVLLALPATTSAVTPGPVVVSLGPVVLSAPGLLVALTLVLRVTAAAGIALLIVWTMRFNELLSALSQLKVPDIIVATLAMAQKQIVSLMRTVEQIHLARESRTLTSGTDAENRGWVTGRMAFVVQRSLSTADEVYDAMLARGFDGSMRLLHRGAAGPRDWRYLAAALAVCTLMIVIDRGVLHL